MTKAHGLVSEISQSILCCFELHGNQEKYNYLSFSGCFEKCCIFPHAGTSTSKHQNVGVSAELQNETKTSSTVGCSQINKAKEHQSEMPWKQK